jgi:hypothetical protein
MSKKQLNVTLHKHGQMNLGSLQAKEFKWSVGLDLSFQSPARWPSSQKTEYMTSLIIGRAPTSIVVAHIDSCMEKLSKHSRDYAYFKKWKDLGFKWISIDGNNRTITIDEYLAGKVSIEHREYLLPSGPVEINSKNDRYNTHPQEMRDYINSFIFVPICEYVNATRADLSDLFTSINHGVALNAQELRNAVLVDFAEEVRDLVQEYGDAFKYISKAKDNSRRARDEQIVNLAVYNALGAVKGISKSNKDDAYKDNSTVSMAFEKGGRKIVEDTLKMIIKYADAGFKDVSTLMNLFMAVKHLHKEGRKIQDKQKFFEWFMSSEAARIGNQKLIAETKKGQWRNYAGCNDTTSAPFLEKRYDYIVKDLQDISMDIVFTPDPERLFTPQQRYAMWERQNGICPRTRKKIPKDQINNHELWAADHVKPYSKGGPTTLDNGELVCKEYNLAKSNKMPELLAA